MVFDIKHLCAPYQSFPCPRSGNGVSGIGMQGATDQGEGCLRSQGMAIGDSGEIGEIGDSGEWSDCISDI